VVEHDLFGKPVSTPQQVRGVLFQIMLWSFFRSDQIGTEAPVFRSGAFSSREAGTHFARKTL